MKISKLISIKDTVSLFSNKYRYKVVVVTPTANWFRNGDLDFLKTRIDLIKENGNKPVWLRLKGPEDLEHAIKVRSVLLKFSDYNIRVEHPYVNVYTNDSKLVEDLAGLDPQRINYISIPNKSNPGLQQGSVICKKIDHKYKVFLGKTTQNYSNFLEWAKTNDKVKLTKRAQKDLSKDRSYGGSYLYVRDEKSLTMVRMFIGTCISKIESVIKA